ncbi:MAG: glycoside hydrolase [Verrucomicrobiae bacterium]|nr:glycoside hydrolase [Verrucomicrobiae bacterium]
MAIKPSVIVTVLLAGNLSAAEPIITTRYVAIDNVCAWPNLATLRDGTIVATIFNQPSHGRAEGDVDVWATRDGLFWAKRGTAAPHEDSANRMNVAAGVANNGDLLVLSSGWSLKKDDRGKVLSLVNVLAPWVCRSADGGVTWKVDKDSFPRATEGRTEFIPFGDVLPGGDGTLRVTCYARDKKTKQRLDLFRSIDDGKSWTFAEAVSGAPQHPGHLMRLKDGRLLVTYGNRIKGQFGVLARLSADDGKTWGEPLTLVSDLLSGDCGYPASAQMRDGKILTAYYSNGAPAHRRYHMGVVIWQPPAK